MKKSILLGIAAVGLLLSSCLGDNETTVKGGNAFGVVRKLSNYSGGNVLALSTGNYIIWDDLKNYTLGDALIIGSYEFGSSDIVSGNVIKASYINVSKDYPVNVQKEVATSAVDTTANVKAGIGAVSINIGMNDPGTFFSDKMLMNYTVNKTKSDIYDIQFVYDKDLQVDAKKQPLKEGYRVLDVVFTKRGDDTGNKDPETTTIVADMTRLRNTLLLLNQKQIVVGFRYSKYDTATKSYKLVYEPSVFGMNFDSQQ